MDDLDRQRTAQIVNELRDLMARKTTLHSKEAIAIGRACSWLRNVTAPLTDEEENKWLSEDGVLAAEVEMLDDFKFQDRWDILNATYTDEDKRNAMDVAEMGD